MREVHKRKSIPIDYSLDFASNTLSQKQMESTASVAPPTPDELEEIAMVIPQIVSCGNVESGYQSGLTKRTSVEPDMDEKQVSFYNLY